MSQENDREACRPVDSERNLAFSDKKFEATGLRDSISVVVSYKKKLANAYPESFLLSLTKYPILLSFLVLFKQNYQK